VSDDGFEAEIRELEPQLTVCARITTPMNTLGDLFSRVPGSVLSRIQAGSTHPSGPLYARYHVFGPEDVDVEIGFPVSAPLAELAPVSDVVAGDVGSGSLPGGRVAYTVHRGSYDDLSKSYDRLHDWIHAAGHDEGKGPWEVYLDDPGDMSDMSKVRTEIIWPLG
jgi:effector-binding domain-containing protein